MPKSHTSYKVNPHYAVTRSFYREETIVTHVDWSITIATCYRFTIAWPLCYTITTGNMLWNMLTSGYQQWLCSLHLFSKRRSKAILPIFSNRFQFRLKDSNHACYFEGDLLHFSHVVPHVPLYDKQAITLTTRSFFWRGTVFLVHLGLHTC